MSKLPEANLTHLPAVTAAETASAIGMAALWTSAFKRMLYPMVYTYYRTGDADVIAAQGIYAIVFALACLVLFAAREKIAGNPRSFRWVAVLLGICGAAGIGLLQVASDPTHASPELYALSGLLAAAYIPAHIAFWFVVARGLPEAQARRSLVLSFVVFAGSYALLELAGAQTMLVSIICPLISAAMALAIPMGHVGVSRAEDQPPAQNGARSEQATFANASDASVSALCAPEAGRVASGTQANSQARPENGATAATDAQAATETAPATVAAAATAGPTEMAAMPGDSHPNAQPPTGDGNADDAGQRQATASSFGAEGKLFDPLIEQFAEDFGLSDREAELAAYTYRNYSARRIAGELFIAESTVYTHQKRIYRKCGVHSKSELIAQIDAWKRQQAATSDDGLQE